MRQGVTPGVPDIIVLLPTKTHHGLLIELKSNSGKTTDKQQQMIERLLAVGYRVEVCKSLDEVILLVRDYFGEELRNYVG